MVYQIRGASARVPQFTSSPMFRQHGQNRLHKLRRSPVDQVSRVTALAQVETSASNNVVSTAYWDVRRHPAGTLCQRPG